MKTKFNFRAYLVIFSLLIVIYLVLAILFETIMKNNADYGRVGNFLILNFGELFQYPSVWLMTSNNNFYLLGILFNLCFYAGILYFVVKFLFKKLRKD